MQPGWVMTDFKRSLHYITRLNQTRLYACPFYFLHLCFASPATTTWCDFFWGFFPLFWAHSPKARSFTFFVVFPLPPPPPSKTPFSHYCSFSFPPSYFCCSSKKTKKTLVIGAPPLFSSPLANRFANQPYLFSQPGVRHIIPSFPSSHSDQLSFLLCFPPHFWHIGHTNVSYCLLRSSTPPAFGGFSIKRLFMPCQKMLPTAPLS